MTQTWGRGAGTPPHRPRASIRPSPYTAVAVICLVVTWSPWPPVLGWWPPPRCRWHRPIVTGGPTGGSGPHPPCRRRGDRSRRRGRRDSAPTVTIEPRDSGPGWRPSPRRCPPRAPQYGRYLPRGQFGATFGPSTSTLSAVRAWLVPTGLRVAAPSPDGLLIRVTGTVAQMEQHLRGAPGRSASTRRTGGAAETANPEVPAALAGFIGGVIGLSTVARAHPQLRPGPSASTTLHGSGSAATPGLSGPHAGPSACPAARDATAGSAWTADQLAATYGLNTLYGQGRVGAGQQVGIFELEPFTAGDISSYQA